MFEGIKRRIVCVIGKLYEIQISGSRVNRLMSFNWITAMLIHWCSSVAQFGLHHQSWGATEAIESRKPENVLPGPLQKCFAHPAPEFCCSKHGLCTTWFWPGRLLGTWNLTAVTHKCWWHCLHTGLSRSKKLPSFYITSKVHHHLDRT